MALFVQVGDQVGQIKDHVGQGQGQELDNISNYIEQVSILVLLIGIYFIDIHNIVESF